MSKRGKAKRADYTLEELKYVKFMGKKLKKRRNQLGLTQTKVGKLIRTSFQQVQKYETGVNVPSTVKIERLRQALNVPTTKVGFLFNKLSYLGFPKIFSPNFRTNFPLGIFVLAIIISKLNSSSFRRTASIMR